MTLFKIAIRLCINREILQRHDFIKLGTLVGNKTPLFINSHRNININTFSCVTTFINIFVRCAFVWGDKSFVSNRCTRVLYSNAHIFKLSWISQLLLHAPSVAAAALNLNVLRRKT